MWILPKQLHTLDSVRDTEALSLGLEESSQLCAQSLFVRSKRSPLRTWLQKWKRDSWTQHLYGRILKPSLGKAFETEWTSLLEVTHVNHLAQQGSEQERMTQDTSGLGSQTEFGFCDQECASLRMSKDTSRWDSPASSATWKNWVTGCRGEYSARVKLVQSTNASGCSSWPTASVMDTTGGSYKTEWKDGRAVSYHNHTVKNPVAYGAKLADAVKHGMQDAWQTPTTNMDMVRSEEGIQKRKEFRASIGRKSIPDGNLGEQMQRFIKHGPPAPANHSTHGSRQESWATPRANKVHPEITEENREQLATRNKSNLEEEIAGHCGTATGKLNPRWVETLMGIPIGWTMPSCTRPVTIVQTNCDCLETESFQQLPSEHLELF